MIEIVHRYIIPAAYAVLPPEMESVRATAHLVAICLQESKALHRRQLPRTPDGPFGPAMGLWQFEKNGGIKGVMTHPDTRGPLNHALRVLRYEHLIGRREDLYRLVQDNDVVAAVFARLNLWWLPSRLPTRDESAEAWQQYLEAWRPGKPHPDTWPAYFMQAWDRVEENT